jgi:hypothetical protein
MSLRLRKLALAVVAVSAVAGLSACTTTQSTRAKALKTTGTGPTSLAECQHITVRPFSVPAGKRVDPNAGGELARDVERRLSSDFGPIFQSVEYADAARNIEGECVVEGAITKYKKGSRFARAMLIGLGPASLEGTVTVRTAAGTAPLLNTTFDKLWAWGGIMGASKGIEEMTDETAASLAATLAQAKGWQKPGTATTP